jgi:hypothetical protein
MRHRLLGPIALAATLAITAANELSILAAQEGTAAGKAVGNNSSIPRTPEGRPDLQGVWTNFESTPVEAPSPEDAARLAPLEPWFPGISRPGDQRTIEGPNPSNVFNDTARRSQKRRSLIVDPPDGRAPLRPEAIARRALNLKRLTESWEFHTPWERCITRGVPGGMLPAGYNNGYRITQTADYITILYEMIHEPRIIPLDGRPHVDARIRLWNGDSRGRWENDTLVVDVTNYRAEEVGTVASGIATTATMKGVAQSEAMHVVERFTRTSGDTIEYEMKIEDPQIYTKPWTVAMPLNRADDYDVREYACHEGNYGLRNSLSGARVAEGTLKFGSVPR